MRQKKIIAYLTKVAKPGEDMNYFLKCGDSKFFVSKVDKNLPLPEEESYRLLSDFFGSAIEKVAEANRGFFNGKAKFKLCFNTECLGEGEITFGENDMKLDSHEYEIDVRPNEMIFFLNIFCNLRTPGKFLGMTN